MFTHRFLFMRSISWCACVAGWSKITEPSRAENNLFPRFHSRRCPVPPRWAADTSLLLLIAQFSAACFVSVFFLFWFRVRSPSLCLAAESCAAEMRLNDYFVRHADNEKRRTNRKWISRRWWFDTASTHTAVPLVSTHTQKPHPHRRRWYVFLCSHIKSYDAFYYSNSLNNIGFQIERAERQTKRRSKKERTEKKNKKQIIRKKFSDRNCIVDTFSWRFLHFINLLSIAYYPRRSSISSSLCEQTCTVDRIQVKRDCLLLFPIFFEDRSIFISSVSDNVKHIAAIGTIEQCD